MAAALSLTVYNMHEANEAGAAADAVLERVNITVVPDDENKNPADSLRWEPAVAEGVVPEMPTIEIDGEHYIGRLDVPKLSLALPICGEWSYPLLKVSPCRYTGSVYDDSMTIAGHNYRRHFSRLVQLKKGDIITFTDANGYVWTYAVSGMETIDPTEYERMTVADGWDLTLFTCSYNGTMRRAIRCVRLD